MNTSVASAVSTLVTLKDGKPVTTSRIVAESFNRHHKHVLDSIDAIISSAAYQERRQPNFRPTSYLVDMPNGSTRQERMFEMDRQGFEILAMGFTGEEAQRPPMPPARPLALTAPHLTQAGREALAAYLEDKERVTLKELASDVFAATPDRALEVRIGRALKALGWERHRATGGNREYFYERKAIVA